MADTKISALPASTTPLTGNETLPVVQGGVTKKVSVANLTAGRSVATAGGSFTDNLVQGTAAKGVNFTANTPAAGMTSQLLNWYEEGTFTATLTGGSAAPTSPPTVSARYTRVGRQVTVQLNFSNVNTTGGSGTLLVTGLPFTNSAQGTFGSCFFIGNGTAAGVAYVQPSSSQIAFLEAATGAYINMVAGTNKYLGLTVTYTV